MSDFDDWLVANMNLHGARYELAKAAYLAGQSSAEQRVKEWQEASLINERLRIELQAKCAELERELTNTQQRNAYLEQDLNELKAQAGEPYRYLYMVNGAHECYSESLPPDDAYDEGTLVPLYLTTPSAPAAEPEDVEYLHDLLGKANALCRIRQGRIDELVGCIERMRVAGGSHEFQMAFELAKDAIGHGKDTSLTDMPKEEL